MLIKKEYLFPLICMAVGGLFYYQTYHLNLNVPEPMSSARYARIVIIFMEFWGCVYIINDLCKHRETAKKPEKGNSVDGEMPLVLGIIILSFLYGISFIYIGYFVISFIYVFLLITFLSIKNIRIQDLLKNLIISIAVVALLYICFKKFLNIYFPDSLLF